MIRQCETCHATMTYMGEWPCRAPAPNRMLTIQCHRWKCDQCKTYPYEPITDDDARKLKIVAQRY